ncbi:hypothetical protein D1AOALGA4SA_5114 [Olavius algarvensis Delta 1 endosymbiont]|nr:hypothetical protein D1AOALGA4SA_5114 [Olavius algarvensis Delta 1 endosymbiont]
MIFTAIDNYLSMLPKAMSFQRFQVSGFRCQITEFGSRNAEVGKKSTERSDCRLAPCMKLQMSMGLTENVAAGFIPA